MPANVMANRVRSALPPVALSLVRSFRGVGRFVTSDYAKHLGDARFLDAWEAARHDTLVDVLRLHELWSLVRQSAKLAPGCYLEVGVWRGGSGLVIAKSMENAGISAPLYLADTFTGVVKTGDSDKTYSGGEHADTSEERVVELMKRNRVDNVRILRGIFPEDTSGAIDGAIRMVHVDVDVYQGGKDIVEWAYPRMVSGGIIVFDDYGFLSCSGVTKLGEEYEADSRFFFLHNWNGHAVLVKR